MKYRWNFIHFHSRKSSGKRRPFCLGPNVLMLLWHHCKHSWWRHQTETFSTLLAICAGNSPVNGEFPAQRPVTRSFDVFFDLHMNKRLSKQSWGWWFETQSRPLWRHRNANRQYLPYTLPAESSVGDKNVPLSPFFRTQFMLVRDTS